MRKLKITGPHLFLKQLLQVKTAKMPRSYAMPKIPSFPASPLIQQDGAAQIGQLTRITFQIQTLPTLDWLRSRNSMAAKVIRFDTFRFVPGVLGDQLCISCVDSMLFS